MSGVLKRRLLLSTDATHNEITTDFTQHRHCRLILTTNLYGSYKNIDFANSRFRPALIRKLDRLKKGGATNVQIWGSDIQRRGYLYADDLTDANTCQLQSCSSREIANIGRVKEFLRP